MCRSLKKTPCHRQTESRKRTPPNNARLRNPPKLKKTFHEPRRAAEVVMALWVMPWVDADGDFHGASRIWLKVEDARWQLERERSRATASTPAPEDF